MMNNSSAECDSPTDQSKAGPSREKTKDKTKTKLYKQKFRDEWIRKFGSWLYRSPNSLKPKCQVCNKRFEGGYSHIQRHALTQSHLTNLKKCARTPKINTIIGGNDKPKQAHSQAKEGELKMVMFLHEHNFPFLIADHLPALIRNICPDSEIAKRITCARTKATAITKDCLAPEALEEIRRRLEDNVYSLIIDKTTDVSTAKSLAIVIRFFDGDQKQVVDHFLGLIRIKTATAENIFQEVSECLKKVVIDMKKMIGFAADNASVMMGNIKGVQARFKEIIPHIFVLGCVCHSFHLCASAAALKLPRAIEDFVRSIYNHFSNSSKRVEELAEYQTFVELKPNKMLRPSQTRWLSLQAAVNRVLENWDALILFFTNAAYNDNLHSTDNVLACLKNPIYKLYLNFLSYILDFVNKLNLEFQSAAPKIQSLNQRVSELLKTILGNYLLKSYIDNTPLDKICPRGPRNFLPMEKIYFGPKVELLISGTNIEAQELANFKVRALDFHVELGLQIQCRFDFNSPMLKFVKMFSVANVVAGEIPSIVVATVKNFPNLFQKTDLDKLDAEWRLLPNIEDLKKWRDLDFVSFWIRVGSLKNNLGETMFPCLYKLSRGIMSLLHSSACAERIFSQLTLLKTKRRNRLAVETCSAILHAKDLLNNETCYKWQPSDTLLAKKPNI